MKRFALFFTLCLSTISSYSQDLFYSGLQYLKTGQYTLADSVFRLYLSKYPNDLSALFNYGSTKFQLGDTCTFCEIMFNLSHSYHDKQAGEIYYTYCGSADTVFRDKNFVICEKKKSRYTIVTETHRCQQEYKTVYVHDKRNQDGTVIMNADVMNLKKTDIIAYYILFNNDSTLFLFTKTPPSFIGGDEAEIAYMENNTYVLEAKKKLNISKLVVSVEYIVDKTGNIKNLKITHTNKPVYQMDILKNYVDLIVAGLPKKNPGQYQNENVDYLVDDSISIW